MPTSLQLALGINPAHHNQYLFSDHYLNNLLPADPRWPLALDEAPAFLTWLQDLYAQEQAQLAHYTESQLEDHWFKPILTQLGHTFERQASVPGLDAGVKRPDYVFFPDEATRQAAVRAQRTAEYAAHALAVGEVKRWDVPLGKKQRGGGASFEAQNPSWQIDYYVRATGLTWGLLSNGRLWRLVQQDTSQRLAIYYEVDLVNLLTRGDAEVLRYFTIFFRQAALRPDDQGRVFLDDALAASNAYAVALEEDLEQNVYQALERLMQGFLDLPANSLGPGDLRAIYDNSLYLLYRLLFILYGESRGLLPLGSDQYRTNYSLTRIKQDITTLQMSPAPMTTLYWGRLHNLFHIINGDNPELNRYLGVPRYDGRLFDPAQHPFLEQKAVGDRALVAAIDLLCRRTTQTGREFVDYRTLGVRHLGSIYEGLLEYQPRYAAEPMVAIRDRKGERWVSAGEVPAGARVIEQRDAGQVYLETDRGERKATGSYYTPQYIVEYIVDNTLGSLVDEAVQRVKARAKAAKSKAARVQAEQSLVDEVLNLKVLDPAMGSGHFLVEATEYLALALATDPYVEVEISAEEDLIHWKRRVVERCIYGVDKNPLAVELAKLSLWLATVAADKPLSFLDHHLKCGDSLVGARVADLGDVPPVMLSKKMLRERAARYSAGVRQANLFETRLSAKLPVVMGRILEITEVASDSYDTVQAKEAADRAVQQLKAPFEAVADLWVSAYFGNEFINGEYDEALMQIGQPDILMALPAVQRAKVIADERRFFHWELAFPEVFYDRHGQPLRDKAGFDIVVGNPPYGFISDKALQTVIAAHYTDAQSYNFYTAFVERSIHWLRWRGLAGWITPTSWQTGIGYADMRAYLLTHCHLLQLIILPYDVFPQAYVDTGIYIIRRDDSPQTEPALTYLFEKRGEASTALQRGLEFTPIDPARWHNDHTQGRVLLNPTVLSLIGNLESTPTIPLEELCDTARGILVAPEHLAIHSTLPTHRSFFDGDLYRYVIHWKPETWVDYGDHLAEKPARPDYFAGPRILMRRLVSRRGELMACFVQKPFVNTKDIYNLLMRDVPYAPLYVTAMLNSRLLAYVYIMRSTVARKDDFPQVTLQGLRRIPIRRIEFTTPADERQQLVIQAQALHAAGDTCPVDAAALLAFTDDRLAADPEQADVVHDLLAYLAQQMIQMHQRKQTAVEAFWLDLEGVTDEPTFQRLRYKGKQEHTLWKRSAAACRPYVREDSHATRRLDESLAWSEDAFKGFVKTLVRKVVGLSDLVSVYRAHSPAYRELVARIAATDRLIDQIIYKLYGLTENEIAIVEGRDE